MPATEDAAVEGSGGSGRRWAAAGPAAVPLWHCGGHTIGAMLPSRDVLIFHAAYDVLPSLSQLRTAFEQC